MKLLSLFMFILSFNTFANACPDISGKFQGRCTETFPDHPELVKTPELGFAINQSSCDNLDVTMSVFPSGVLMKDVYDFKAGKMVMIDADNVILYSSGLFDADSFVGTIEYVSKSSWQTVFTFKTKYTKVDKAGVPYLLVHQSSEQSILECDIPAI